MHEFYQNKYIWPDKYPVVYTDEVENKKKEKAKYLGGLVLEP